LKQIRIFLIIFILTFLILAGCGGGGGGGGGGSSSNSTGSNTSNTSNSEGAGTISLAWDANASSAIAGYKVYYGTSSGNYPDVINVGNTTTYTVSNLQSGHTYYFAVTDYETSGNESQYSNEISGTAK
jgi:fibronectin type 3 domain-containing protein